ncbi:mono/diheme cytochrome c family protein [Pseudochelatococcus lubricantis]|uniref:Mono/diheme cytochrome c family protein n=1 Tax=Pseudochelatococcus lubricantis TaxID=1538102 RepID=A0ABX0V1B3_9HYPH|nr:cytochrome c [Pseudochelatococcus lubricantis]NIJ58085.1 mono/diheme cytochrome c family protein [Pseudochelatococcus lubricantis]
MQRWLVRALVLLLVAAVIGGGAFWWLTSPDRITIGREPVPAGEADIANGRLLFDAGDCAACHATPGGDRLHLGGGLAMHTQFGTFHVPNISPHETDGIGGWSVQDFVRAMRAGVSPDGRHYYPSFPYTSFQRIGPKDLADMFAYVRTLTPVPGRAPAHDLAFPFSMRRGVGLWKLAFLDGREFEPDPSKSAEWNRGKFLVEGPAHCAECHSPRNFAGAIIAERRFSGGPNPDGAGFVPNITPHETGIGGWSKSDVVELLTTGFTPEFDSVGASMRAVVENTARLPPEDREAMAEYLLSLPPVASSPR